jgi:uncharacterized protein (TIGR00299 family) protein
MQKSLYLDSSSGVSGYMFLGALIDLGLPLQELRDALERLLPDTLTVVVERVTRSGIGATQFSVRDQSNARARHRDLSAIKALVGASALPERVRDRAMTLFERLAAVEAGIHQIPVERVHFHEVGALDSIVDIVGTIWALDRLGIAEVWSSPLNVGSGTVQTEHGVLPVPAPATMRLLEGVPVYGSDGGIELVTPTGALLVTAYVRSFGPMPPMIVERTGSGAGSREVKGAPNILRATIGRRTETRWSDRVLVAECNIDDMNPQLYGAVLDMLYAAGALEVFFTPVQMKKNRPGTLVTTIAPPDRRDAVLEILFRETTSIGVRYQEMARECLRREIVEVATPYGGVHLKLAARDGVTVNVTPEFDDCVRLARQQSVPIKDVQAAALRAYLERNTERDS